MGQILATFQNQPAHRLTMALGDGQFTMRLTWRERLAAWYADLWAANGIAVFLGQRVSTLWGLGLGLQPENGPAGELFVRGPAEYSRSDLGNTVKIVFYGDDEMDAVRAAAATDDFPITVEIP